MRKHKETGAFAPVFLCFQPRFAGGAMATGRLFGHYPRITVTGHKAGTTAGDPTMPPHLPILALALAVAAPALARGPAATATIDHQAQIDHHSGPVTARYRGALLVDHRQLGAAAPAGRAASLRCEWTARLSVDRHAVTAAGTTARRSFVSDRSFSGHRPGWCAGQRDAITRDVAARTMDLDRHIQAVAREDHDLLRAELDRLHGSVAAG